jgi:hypothetical protein
MKYIPFLVATLFWISCNQAKVVDPTNNHTNSSAAQSTGLFDVDGKTDQSMSVSTKANDAHTVTVLQVLPTDKYVYMKVSEDQEEFWVAVSSQDVEVGEKYFFKGGLLKTNFHSKEYDRVFDKVYLVSKLMPLSNVKTIGQTASVKASSGVETKMQSGNRHPESVSIADIVSDPESYKGKRIIVSGQCTKLNANIMNRNWIHLKDGSNDEYDFVVTSDLAVPEGHFVSMKGVITLDKDFGAGYRYSIIMEEAEIVK